MFQKLARYLEMSDNPERLPPGMLGAFAACFTWNEVCDALVHLIDGDYVLRRPILNRIMRLAQDRPDADALRDLVPKLLTVAAENTRLRRRVGSILSSLFEYLPSGSQREVITYWKSGRGRDSQDRWLKAVDRYDQFFDPDDIFRYWQQTHYYAAARLIAYKAPSEFVQEVLDDLIEHCEEGWIISRAALRVPELSEVHLDSIKARFPVSYAYLCAKLGKTMSKSFAIGAFVSEGPDILTGNRPLILWSIGHLGMWDTLEKICQLWPDLRDQEFGYWRTVKSQAPHIRKPQDNLH